MPIPVAVAVSVPLSAVRLMSPEARRAMTLGSEQAAMSRSALLVMLLWASGVVAMGMAVLFQRLTLEIAVTVVRAPELLSPAARLNPPLLDRSSAPVWTRVWFRPL